MPSSHPVVYIVRPNFWRICARWVVIVQTVLTVVVGTWLIFRAITTATPGHMGDFVCGGMTYLPATGYAVFLAARHWSFVQVRVTETGLHQSGTFIAWEWVSEVRRRYSFLSGKVLDVKSAVGGVVTLPARLPDPERLREAVELFAGPDHPLTRALASVADEG